MQTARFVALILLASGATRRRAERESGLSKATIRRIARALSG